MAEPPGPVKIGMRWIALVLSSFVAALGAIGVVWPEALLGVARHLQTPSGVYAAAALRILLGGALFLAAPVSRAPRAIRALGIFILAAGLTTPFLGTERVRGIIDWWSGQGGFLRVWAALALGLGGWLTWALLRPARGRGGEPPLGRRLDLPG